MGDSKEKEKDKKVKPAPMARLNRGGGAASPLANSPTNSFSQTLMNRSSLQSFKPQRDLTLGGVSGGGGGAVGNNKPLAKPLERKKFVPNLSLSRQVKKEVESDSVDKKNNSLGKRKKENKHERREKFNRDKPSLIQTDSIFSQGVGGETRRRQGGGASDGGGGGGGGGAEAPSLIKPKLELGKVCDRAEEDKKLQNLLHDEFIDDLRQGNNLPIQLPMIETGNIFKAETKQDPDGSEDLIRPKILHKKKSELDSDDDDDPDESSRVPPPPAAHQPGKELGGGQDITSPAAVTNIIKESEGQMLFFQLPDRIPVEQTSNTGESVIINGEDGGKQVNSDADSSLTGLEGRLGELQIRKDGSCQFVIGQQRFDMEVGTQVGFLQDLVSIRVPHVPNETGELTVLGHIANRLIVSPDWDTLLHHSGLDRDLA